ncbi:hypothetical protein LSUE1_G002728, partial [Lachnellula suecica]
LKMRPSLVLLVAFASSGTALEALTNSPCAVQCGNVLGGTSGADIACQDSAYGTTPGLTFQTCTNCQLTSNYVDPVTKQTDLQWALYNLRYAVSWCLFGYPNNTQVGDSPCVTSTACGQLQGAIEYDSLSSAAGAYSFCPLYTPTLVNKCTNCTSLQTSEFYLTNFAIVLDAACQQQPSSGATISVSGNIFSNTLVQISNPTSSSTSTYNGSSGGLSLGAKIGIAVGALLLALGIAGFCIVWNGRRRRRRFLAKHQERTGYADWLAKEEAAHDAAVKAHATPIDTGSAGGFFDSPQSTRPLVSSRPWAPGQKEEESPMSAVGEKVYFSPYSSNYSSPVSASEAAQAQSSQQWPQDRKGSLTGLGRSRSRDTEEEGDRIEMQNVAPVLLHPGHGRGGGAPYLPGLSEEDVKRGNAM